MLKTEFHPAHKSGSKALMVVLHGLGDSAAGYQFLPPALALPWMNYLLVNAPDPYYGGFSERRGVRFETFNEKGCN